MNQRLVSGMRAALFDSDLVATRLALALAELAWAVMLLWPGDTFSRPTYTLMAAIAPELCWAGVFMITSAVQYLIVTFGLYQTRFARAFSCWNAALWVTTIGSMLLSVYPPPAAIGGEFALMVFAVWIWARPLVVKRGERRYAVE